jgi:hypothetical protein
VDRAPGGALPTLAVVATAPVASVRLHGGSPQADTLGRFGGPGLDAQPPLRGSTANRLWRFDEASPRASERSRERIGLLLSADPTMTLSEHVDWMASKLLCCL